MRCEEGQLVLLPGDQAQGVQRDAAGLGAQAAEVHRQPPVDEEPRVVGGGDGDPRAGLVKERGLRRHRSLSDVKRERGEPRTPLRS